MYKAFSSTKLFVIAYLALVLPTLHLADTAAVEQGVFLTTFNLPALLYIASMLGIWALCYIRGSIIGKQWLVAIPTVAFVFDLTPSLVTISAVPYLYHLLAIIIGVASPLVAINHDRYGMR